MQPLQITIVGGGFCGMMTAVNLVRSVTCPVRISVINKGNPFGRGVAFSPASPSLLLNVRNCNMGAFAEDAGHFLAWLKKQPGYCDQPGEVLADSFSPREVYGNYLAAIWQKALLYKSPGCTVNIYDDLAYKMVHEAGQYYVYLAENPVLQADVVVLATGNGLPRIPAGISIPLAQSEAYYGNPWAKSSLEDVNPGQDVLIIGNGLTMADAVVGLIEKGFNGTIYTISPHGFNLHRHTEDKPPYQGLDPRELLADGFDLHYLVKQLNQHRKAAQKLGQSVYPMVDSLRPYLQQIWQSFSPGEKRMFLKRIRPFWETARHRLPAQTYHFLQQLRAEGRLITLKGSIKNTAQHNGLLSVALDCHGGHKDLRVQRIINCTGPESNLQLSSNKLLRDMANSGIICADEFGLGIKANPIDGRVIAADGSIHQNLFVAGSALKGALWEITAVPDLRVQVKRVADIIARKAGQYCVEVKAVAVLL